MTHTDVSRSDAGAQYVLPLAWNDDAEIEELTSYLRELAGWIDVIVVDGSPEPLFVEHRVRWDNVVTHIRPTRTGCLNGKVEGVLTGVKAASAEYLVIADDDVRYTRDTLRAVLGQLERAHLVRPQNYFIQKPWHARWDTGRTLLNRAFSTDYPGTFGVRRSALLHAGGYSGDVLFENLELIRTIRAIGGVELCADDIFVGRRPPTVRHFLRQRVRQAYDDFAQPRRLAVELSLLPAILWALLRPGRTAVAVLASIAFAEVGRRRRGGTAVFGPTSSLWAPLWVAERAVCVWIAFGSRMRGGALYRGRRLASAATPQRNLARRLADARLDSASSTIGAP